MISIDIAGQAASGTSRGEGRGPVGEGMEGLSPSFFGVFFLQEQLFIDYRLLCKLAIITSYRCWFTNS